MANPIDKPLTPKQALFVEHYVSNGFNGSQAAISAGHSEKCSRVIACENLTKPNICSKIEQRMKELAEKIGVTNEWKLMALKRNTEQSLDKENASGVTGSIDLINKMDGTYADTVKDLARYNPDKIDEMIEDFKKDY